MINNKSNVIKLSTKSQIHKKSKVLEVCPALFSVNKLLDSLMLYYLWGKQYDELVTWADMFRECDIESKKMILSRIINDVRVSRHYNIEITFTTEIEQFGGVTKTGSFLENGVEILPRLACAG